MAGIGAGHLRKSQQFRQFFSGFLALISHPTLRFDLSGLSRIVGGRLVNILGLISGHEVAGGGSSRPVKVRPRETNRGERDAGERREK